MLKIKLNKKSVANFKIVCSLVIKKKSNEALKKRARVRKLKTAPNKYEFYLL